MRFRPAGGLDLTTGALILGGASLIAVSIVAAVNEAREAKAAE